MQNNMEKKHYKLDITVSAENSIWSNGKERLGIGSFSLKEDGIFKFLTFTTDYGSMYSMYKT